MVAASFIYNSIVTDAPRETANFSQIEVRAIYMQKNDEVGNYSDAKPAFIAP